MMLPISCQMFVFVFRVHPVSLSARICLVGIWCSTVWFNCFRAFLSVYINRFCFLLRLRLHVKFCLIVLTKAILSLNLLTLNYLIHLSTKSQGLGVSLLRLRLCEQFG